MNLTFLHPDALPESVRTELEHAYATIQAVWNVAHEPGGRLRPTCLRWNLAATQATVTATATRIRCTVPDADNRGDVTMDTSGIARIVTEGVYHILGQIRFAPNATGVRATQLYRRGTLIGQQVDVPTAATDARGQASETLWCDRGDTIELVGVQTSGGALNVAVDTGAVRQETFLRIVRVA